MAPLSSDEQVHVCRSPPFLSVREEVAVCMNGSQAGAAVIGWMSMAVDIVGYYPPDEVVDGT